MKTNAIGLIIKLTGMSFAVIFVLLHIAEAQIKADSGNVYLLSLQQAINISKTNNNLVKAAKSEESASNSDLKDAENNALPSIFAGANYQRYTSLTLYQGLNPVKSMPKYPTSDGADASVSANFNLYAGGRQKALKDEQSGKKNLASVNTQEQTGNVGLQVVAQYLDLVRLNDQRRFIKEQVIRAETRVKNITALYNNQKVTRSDLLRAELTLSAAGLDLEQAENDITIASQKLNILLGLSVSTGVSLLDSAAMPRPVAESLVPLVVEASKAAYAIRKTGEIIKIQDARIKSVKSGSSPSVSLYSAYGINYPNNIFFPPVDQAFSIGFVGFKVQYSISSIYQNKHKTAASRIRLQELQHEQQNISDNVRQEAESLLIKYKEAINRIAVNEKSVEQARVNYKIINAKYFNQLALLTDLLDADNLYQGTRYNLVQAQTGALFIYYKLLYTSGNL
ncbi:TolC family protein [Mucilaginibacter sabulilitoris]|uniref:TolC family protein n=1 Tax=Mucilaginibacter sabulilitoris TaxID=1173583 RepID=A0ABZ0TG72_9SPHI|nr:TolC family protein [Mucilaginibacter sabulilitoris]WPU91581.1 TolC family protein [Mucilaginibacter sabulilitoris]